MPDNLFSKRLARLRSTYRNSGLRRFLAWWGGELAALLPTRVRDQFVERRDEIRIEIAPEGGFTLTRVPATSEADVHQLAVDAVTEDWQSALIALRARSEVPADLVLIVERRGVLDRHLSLPLAAEDNLAQVIAFEMDRQTPFKPEQVRFDHRVTKRDLVARQLGLDLLIAPKTVVDAATAPVNSAGLALDAIDILATDGRRSGFNLLPPESRAPRSRREQQLNWLLAAIVVLLAWSAMSLSIHNRERVLADLQADVDQVRVEARKVAKLDAELTDAVSGANFLTEKKLAHPIVIDIIKDLTERLPENTSLQRLSVNRGEVQIQGASAEASALIAILQKSALIEGPAVQGAITPDPRTQKEQFMIQARAKTKLAEVADATATEG